MTQLIKYEAAKSALAAARSADEVKDIRDKAEAMRAYARMAKDMELEADAAEIRVRAERRLGDILIEAKKTGQISRGQPKKNSADQEEYSRVRLAETGIDHKLSARAQQIAAIPADDFNVCIARVRERIREGDRVSLDVSKPVNGARSIMSSRQEPDDSLDYFPTPPWATRALMEEVFPATGRRSDSCWNKTVWEPACGEGHIAEVLGEYFREVRSSDIADYGYGTPFCDFLSQEPQGLAPDWIITNPPFGDKTEAFVLRALKIASIGVAMFVRLQWLETIGRYEAIFRDRPPTIIAFFAERVNLRKNDWNPKGSTATAYIWLAWIKAERPHPPFWIPPGQREALTRPDDVERFTAHPVIKRDLIPHDPETGEVIESEFKSPPSCGGRSEPASVIPSPSTGAGSSSDSTYSDRMGNLRRCGDGGIDDPYKIPEFLRRKSA